MKLNWGIGIGIVYIAFAAGMILFAVKASHEKNELVTEHYYEEAVQYQQTINAGTNTARLHSKLSIRYLPERNVIEISLDGDVKNVQGTLSFYKPDKAKDDFLLPFHTNDSGKQLIPLNKMAPGFWKVKSSWNVNGESCYAENILNVPNP